MADSPLQEEEAGSQPLGDFTGNSLPPIIIRNGDDNNHTPQGGYVEQKSPIVLGAKEKQYANRQNLSGRLSAIISSTKMKLNKFTTKANELRKDLMGSDEFDEAGYGSIAACPAPIVLESTDACPIQQPLECSEPEGCVLDKETLQALIDNAKNMVEASKRSKIDERKLIIDEKVKYELVRTGKEEYQIAHRVSEARAWVKHLDAYEEKVTNSDEYSSFVTEYSHVLDLNSGVGIFPAVILWFRAMGAKDINIKAELDYHCVDISEEALKIACDSLTAHAQKLNYTVTALETEDGSVAVTCTNGVFTMNIFFHRVDSDYRSGFKGLYDALMPYLPAEEGAHAFESGRTISIMDPDYGEHYSGTVPGLDGSLEKYSFRKALLSLNELLDFNVHMNLMVHPLDVTPQYMPDYNLINRNEVAPPKGYRQQTFKNTPNVQYSYYRQVSKDFRVEPSFYMSKVQGYMRVVPFSFRCDKCGTWTKDSVCMRGGCSPPAMDMATALSGDETKMLGEDAYRRINPLCISRLEENQQSRCDTDKGLCIKVYSGEHGYVRIPTEVDVEGTTLLAKLEFKPTTNAVNTTTAQINHFLERMTNHTVRAGDGTKKGRSHLNYLPYDVKINTRTEEETVKVKNQIYVPRVIAPEEEVIRYYSRFGKILRVRKSSANCSQTEEAEVLNYVISYEREENAADAIKDSQNSQTRVYYGERRIKTHAMSVSLFAPKGKTWTDGQTEDACKMMHVLSELIKGNDKKFTIPTLKDTVQMTDLKDAQRHPKWLKNLISAHIASLDNSKPVNKGLTARAVYQKSKITTKINTWGKLYGVQGVSANRTLVLDSVEIYTSPRDIQVEAYTVTSETVMEQLKLLILHKLDCADIDTELVTIKTADVLTHSELWGVNPETKRFSFGVDTLARIHGFNVSLRCSDIQQQALVYSLRTAGVRVADSVEGSKEQRLAFPEHYQTRRSTSKSGVALLKFIASHTDHNGVRDRRFRSFTPGSQLCADGLQERFGFMPWLIDPETNLRRTATINDVDMTEMSHFKDTEHLEDLYNTICTVTIEMMNADVVQVYYGGHRELEAARMLNAAREHFNMPPMRVVYDPRYHQNKCSNISNLERMDNAIQALRPGVDFPQFGMSSDVYPDNAFKAVIRWRNTMLRGGRIVRHIQSGCAGQGKDTMQVYAKQFFTQNVGSADNPEYVYACNTTVNVDANSSDRSSVYLPLAVTNVPPGCYVFSPVDRPMKVTLSVPHPTERGEFERIWIYSSPDDTKEPIGWYAPNTLVREALEGPGHNSHTAMTFRRHSGISGFFGKGVMSTWLYVQSGSSIGWICTKREFGRLVTPKDDELSKRFICSDPKSTVEYVRDMFEGESLEALGDEGFTVEVQPKTRGKCAVSGYEVTETRLHPGALNITSQYKKRTGIFRYRFNVDRLHMNKRKEEYNNSKGGFTSFWLYMKLKACQAWRWLVPTNDVNLLLPNFTKAEWNKYTNTLNQPYKKNLSRDKIMQDLLKRHDGWENQPLVNSDRNVDIMNGNLNGVPILQRVADDMLYYFEELRKARHLYDVTISNEEIPGNKALSPLTTALNGIGAVLALIGSTFFFKTLGQSAKSFATTFSERFASMRAAVRSSFSKVTNIAVLGAMTVVAMPQTHPYVTAAVLNATNWAMTAWSYAIGPLFMCPVIISPTFMAALAGAWGISSILGQVPELRSYMSQKMLKTYEYGMLMLDSIFEETLPTWARLIGAWGEAKLQWAEDGKLGGSSILHAVCVALTLLSSSAMYFFSPVLATSIFTGFWAVRVGLHCGYNHTLYCNEEAQARGSEYLGIGGWKKRIGSLGWPSMNFFSKKEASTDFYSGDADCVDPVLV